jgi:diphosphomevalonate decarboxylase
MASTAGMETSRLTSPLLKYRAEHVVEERLADIEKAFLARDFNKFGEITMKDSNQFHAVCMDTYPPIFYMNDVSKAIISLVGALNEHFGEIRAAYTFDAGPNAVIYTLDKVCSHFSFCLFDEIIYLFYFSSFSMSIKC